MTAARDPHNVFFEAHRIHAEVSSLMRRGESVKKLEASWKLYAAKQITKEQYGIDMIRYAGRRVILRVLDSLVGDARKLCALHKLHKDIAGGNVARLKCSIAEGVHFGVHEETIDHAKERLAALQHEASVRARMADERLPTVEDPIDFCCPITCCRMIDPVVASDGKVYEREAIVTHMGDNPFVVVKSPLTREVPTRDLRPANELRRSINAFYRTALEAAAAGASWGREKE